MLIIAHATRHLAFNLPLAKLYTNSLMSSLNARPVNGAEVFSSSRKGRDAQVTSRKVGYSPICVALIKF